MSVDSTPDLLTTLAFYVASAMAIASAVLVVVLKDLVRSVVALTVSFVSVAGIFFTLNAEFIGIVQILVYVGAIAILIAFAVMFIRDLSIAGALGRHAPVAAVVALVLFAGIVFVAYNTNWTGIDAVQDADARAALVDEYYESESGAVSSAGTDAGQRRSGVLIDSSGPIGSLLVRNFLLPFEALGLLMVAAVIGALMVIRVRREDGAP